MKPRETKDKACSEQHSELSQMFFSTKQRGQPDHCRIDVQKVGSQRRSQWHLVNENQPQCMQYPSQLKRKRAAHGGKRMAPDDIKTQWQEANANRMLFKVEDYKDSKFVC